MHSTSCVVLPLNLAIDNTLFLPQILESIMTHLRNLMWILANAILILVCLQKSLSQASPGEREPPNCMKTKRLITATYMGCKAQVRFPMCLGHTYTTHHIAIKNTLPIPVVQFSCCSAIRVSDEPVPRRVKFKCSNESVINHKIYLPRVLECGATNVTHSGRHH